MRTRGEIQVAKKDKVQNVISLQNNIKSHRWLKLGPGVDTEFVTGKSKEKL